MPKGYEHPTPAVLARRFYGTFTSILHTDHNMDEAPWEEMPDEIRSAFVEAMDMIFKEELEIVSEYFDKEVAEHATRRAREIVEQARLDKERSHSELRLEGSCYICERPFFRTKEEKYLCEGCRS